MIGVNAIDVTEPWHQARLEQVLNSGRRPSIPVSWGGDFALSYISEKHQDPGRLGGPGLHGDSQFWLNHLHPHDGPGSWSSLSCLDGGLSEFGIPLPGQGRRLSWMHDEVRLVLDADGKPVEMAGVWIDITDSKRMEEAQQVSLRFLEIVHNFMDINSLLTALCLRSRITPVCEAVGIRVLDADGGIPYQAYDGFRQQFYESETPYPSETITACVLT